MNTLDLEKSVEKFKKELHSFENAEETSEDTLIGSVRKLFVLGEKFRLSLYEQKLSEQKSAIANTYFKTEKIL